MTPILALRVAAQTRSDCRGVRIDETVQVVFDDSLRQLDGQTTRKREGGMSDLPALPKLAWLLKTPRKLPSSSGGGDGASAVPDGDRGEAAKARFAVVRLPASAGIQPWVSEAATGSPEARSIVSVTFTKDECSVIVPEEDVPAAVVAEDGVKVEGGWAALKVLGPLEFELIGILSKLSGVLADAKVSIFALSTYDTDYVLVAQSQTKEAHAALATAGYSIS